MIIKALMSVLKHTLTTRAAIGPIIGMDITKVKMNSKINA